MGKTARLVRWPVCRRGRRALLLLAALGPLPFRAIQPQTCDKLRTDRTALILGAYGVSQAAAIIIRHNDWWPNPSAGFHFAWEPSANRQQDRLLHAALSYQASQLGALAWDWACVPRTTAGWLGGALGVAIALPKEIGDAFQEDRGFSGPDMLWTVGGSILPALHRAWAPARSILVKLNYWPSDEYRNRIGAEPQLESDYAGQRYYLAINPGRLPGGAGPWPDWLGLALGHSVPHWISAPPAHQWYVALDVNFRGIPLRAEWWRTVATVLDQFHVPLPGIRIQGGEVTFGLF
ncbi:MAG: hypothetical protein GTO22_25645 [Gemmatimonadales bacterium]|nr:hypothetical protein [Gemmatimonadales bacterium]